MNRELAKIIGDIRFETDPPIGNTLGIGGRAGVLIIPQETEELVECLVRLDGRKIPFRILGGGSNLLVDDRGVGEVVVRPGYAPEELTIEGVRVEAPAGMELSRLVKAAGMAGLSGLEFAAGIPGTVGGAAAMNAGWGGEEIGGLIRKVWIYRPGEGMVELREDQCRFGYRSSRFQESGEVVLKVELKLRSGDSEKIAARTREVLRQRKEALPLEYPSAGSIFKNPPGDYAGRLIEAAGLKGKRIGGAQISGKHANVIVNRGGAASADVRRLIDLARKEVRRQFGIELELEIRIW